MSVKRKRKYYCVAEKLEVVKASQSGLAREDVAAMFGVGTTTVNVWVRAYEANGLPGLENFSPGRAQKLDSKTEAAEHLIDGIKQHAPEAGISKIQGFLYRHGLLKLGRETVRGILRRKGHEPQTQRMRRKNPPKQPRFFERATPNEMWQTDIMTFMLKGQYRVYVIAFIDDNSRFIVGWGLYRFQTAANVMETFRAAVEKHGMPKELLSDNGRQYYTWRGKSAFGTMLLKMGIKHIRSRPYHPQTLGKIESFWRNLLQECLMVTPLPTFEEAQSKIGDFIEYYNFKRPHQGIGNMTPSDRYFRVADQVQQMVEENTAKVEEQKAPSPDYAPPAYIVGNLGGKELRVVAKEAQVSLRDVENKSIESGGSNENGGSCDGKVVEDKAAEPAGAPGTGAAGPDPRADGGEAVRAIGSVEGAVLPVAEARPGGPAEGAGGQEAGQEAIGAASEPGQDPGPAGTSEAAGAGGGEPAQGEGPLQASDGGGAAGDPPQRLEPGAQAEEEAR